MSHKGKLIASAISTILAMSASGSAVADNGQAAAQETEKCYAISKAGANDCAAGANSCAGSAVKDNQGDAFLFVPKGLCERITGGSLKVVPEKKSS